VGVMTDGLRGLLGSVAATGGPGVSRDVVVWSRGVRALSLAFRSGGPGLVFVEGALKGRPVWRSSGWSSAARAPRVLRGATHKIAWADLRTGHVVVPSATGVLELSCR
jgi:hypothetical protein